MGQVSGKFAKGGELFRLLLDARHFAHTIEQRGDDALRHAGNRFEHGRELRFMNDQGPDRGDGYALASRGFHTGKGEQAGHLPGAADKQRHGAAVLSLDVNLSLEHENHVVGGSTFFKQNFAGVRHQLIAIARQPQAVLKRQTLKGGNAFQGFRNLLNGRGAGGR